jgi:hypothetical protein
MSKEMREQINKVKNWKQFLNENIQTGDLIRINFDMERDPDDGEYGYSIEKGTIGKVGSLINKDETREEEKVYYVKFLSKEGKIRTFGTLINEPLYTKVKENF